MAWQWLNYGRIVTALEGVDAETVEVLLEALDDILASPFEPAWVQVQTLSRSGALERRVAWLPAGWFLTYRPFLDGPPPYKGKHVVVLAMSDVEKIFRSYDL